MESELLNCGMGGWAEVGEFAAFSRKFCCDFVFPRPNPCRLLCSRLAGCTWSGRNKDVDLTDHFVVGSRSANILRFGGECTYTLFKKEAILAAVLLSS